MDENSQEKKSSPDVIVNLYERKVKRMHVSELVSEIMIHMHAFEQGELSKEHKIRALMLLSEGCRREELFLNRQDFETAIRILTNI